MHNNTCIQHMNFLNWLSTWVALQQPILKSTTYHIESPCCYSLRLKMIVVIHKTLCPKMIVLLP